MLYSGAPFFLLAPHDTGYASEVDSHILKACACKNLHRLEACLGHIYLYLVILKLPVPELVTEFLSYRRLFRWDQLYISTLFLRLSWMPCSREQKIKKQFLDSCFRILHDSAPHLGLHHVHSHCHKVADYGFNITAHIAHLGIFGCLDFYKRGTRKLGEAAGDLGLSNTGGTDHDYVLRNDLFPQRLGQHLPSHPVPQCHGHGPLGLVLADYIFIKLFYNLLRSKLIEIKHQSSSTIMLLFV